jgi:hypothetical protein
VVVPNLALFLLYSYRFFPFLDMAGAAPTGRVASTSIIILRVSPLLPLFFLFDVALLFSRLESDVVALVKT